MDRRTLGVLALLLVIAAGLAGCGERRARGRQPHVIVILIDTARSDHFSSYGYERMTTPFCDSLAAAGVLFENCVAQAPWTGPSVASLFTSRYPSQIGVGAVEDSTGRRQVLQQSFTSLDTSETTLAEVLQAGGYETYAVITNPFVEREFGMCQGMQEVENTSQNAARVVDLAIARFARYLAGVPADSSRAAAPLFMYLHFMDVHAPNQPRRPYSTRFPTLDGKPHQREHGKGGASWVNALAPAEKEIFKSHKIALYDGSLAFVDDQIRRLVEFLRDENLAAETVIVVASDHGEGLWDHGLRAGHGFSLYREQLAVPLILSGPGVGGGRVPQQVRNLDILPTLTALAGVEDVVDREGVDLLRLLARGRLAELPAFSEDIAYGFEQKAWRDDRYKYIANRAGPPGRQLFDVRRDPRELEDLADRQAEQCDAYEAWIAELLAGWRVRNAPAQELDDATRQRLKALGY